MGSRIAAAAPVSSGFIASNSNAGLLYTASPQPTPLIYFGGTADPYVLYPGGLFTKNGLFFTSAPTETAIAWWAAFDSAVTPPTVVSMPDLVTTDGSTVECYTYTQPASGEGHAVHFYKIIGGDHSWPGGTNGTTNNLDVDASSLIWDFFKRNGRIVPPVVTVTPAGARPTWTWSPGHSIGGAGVFRYALDGTSLSAAVESTALGFTPGSDLSGGVHTLRVQERNAYGTWSMSTPVSITINSTPVISTAKPAALTMLEDVAGSVYLAASDANGDTLTWSVQTQGGKGVMTVGSTGTSVTAIYTPTANVNGSDTVVIRVSDSHGGTDTITVNVGITAVNDAPVVATAISDQNAAVGVLFTYTVPTNSFTDADGDLLTWSATSLPAWLSFNSVTHTFSGTPTTSDVGSAIITVTVKDPHLAATSDNFTITVAADLTPPATPAATVVTGADPTLPTLSGTTETGATVRVYASGIQVGTTIADGSGAWSWTPVVPLSQGTHVLTVIAVDTAGNSSTASATTTVVVPGGSVGGSSVSSGSDSGGGGGGCGGGALVGVLLLINMLSFHQRRGVESVGKSLCMLTVVSVLLSAPAVAADTAYDPLVISPPTAPTTCDLTVHDAERNRDIPIRVYLPLTTTRCPVVLFSPGLGGSRDNCAYLGAHWASRGYVVVVLQHAGSDASVWEDKPASERMEAMKQAAGIANFLLRAKDVPAVLDQTARWNTTDGHVLVGRLDLTRVGMSGHSFGAVTTQAVSGQTSGVATLSLTDPRIKAAIAFSPSNRGDAAQAFGQVSIPWLLMTGTKDVAPIGGATVASRLAVFPALPAGGKYELVLHGAEHSAFTDRALPGDKEPRNPNHHRAILGLSTAFWDAWLREDPAALAWLDGDGARSLLAKDDRWQRK